MTDKSTCEIKKSARVNTKNHIINEHYNIRIVFRIAKSSLTKSHILLG